MTLPNFLVVGAGRSGTTSLHEYLAQHPDVFMPSTKAPSFFYLLDGAPSMPHERRLTTANHFVHDAAAYEALFDTWSGQAAVGEVSPAYLSAIRVPSRIAERLPGARIVAVIRNPVERVHARFVARRRDGLEPVGDLAAIVRAERNGPLELDDSAGTYLAAGFVSRVLSAYLDRFPVDRVRVYLHEDLRLDAAALLGDLFGFLGVDPDVTVDVSTARNRSGGTIANPVLRYAWTRTALGRARLRRHVPAAIRDRAFSRVTRNLVSEPLDDGLRRELVDIYREEISHLAVLLDRDLSHWLSCSPPETGPGVDR